MVVEIAAGRIVGPGITHGDGLWHLRTAHHDRVAFDLRVSPDKLLVGAGNGEVLRRAVFGGESRKGTVAVPLSL